MVKSARHLPCAGIGGEAEICKVVDVPTNVAGVNGIIRFTLVGIIFLMDDRTTWSGWPPDIVPSTS